MEIEYNLEESIRVDKYLSTCFTDYTRSYIQKLIKDNKVTINDKTAKANVKLKLGDKIHIEEVEPVALDVIGEDLPLDIVYEDDELMVVNKARGMVVHPAPGHSSGTLVNAIMFHCKDRLSSINGVARPGIVHRIDKDTSGLLIICKTDRAHLSIAEQLKEHSIHRIYEAICYNNIKTDEGVIEGTIGRDPKNRMRMAMNVKGGKEARTHYKVLKRLKNNQYTHVECRLETGRTHQIRVHLSAMGNPLIGDPLYGSKKSKFSQTGQMLHAREVGFIHPVSGEFLSFTCEPPEEYQRILTILS